MADNFGLKIGIEGEKEFKRALADINQSFKVLGSEMKLVESEFGKNQNSVQSLTAENEVLTRQIDAQKDKIETLQKALKNASDSFGENDRRTQNWAVQLNNAKAELNGMERELEQSAIDLDKLGDELKKSGNEAEHSSDKFDKLGGVLKGVGVAMGAASLAAGAAAFKLGKEVIEQFGELEQNLGGSEAVFGKYADSIQKIGEEAYKNLGVSQSDYLATANKMGALFQGSGIEQQKSLELTEKAMQRSADMASVMGIDMSMAMEAVTGAAKGNFTMMDNLGVAMNATNIEAYALAKGLDFTWNSATQAEKAEVAMQLFFENTEQYAGNFARESTQTISGSIGLMQAALGSFTAGLGNVDADMTNLTRNLVDAFQAVVKNIAPVIQNIVIALPIAMDAILSAIGDLLPTLLGTVTDLFTQVLETILNLLPELIPVAVGAVMTIVQGLIDNLDKVLEAAFAIIQGLAEGLLNGLPLLMEALPQIIMTIVNFITNNLPAIINMGMQLIVQLAAGLIKAIPQLVASLPQIISALVLGLGKAVGAVFEIGKNIVTGLWNGIKSMGNWISEKVSGFFSGIVNGTKNLLGIHSPSTVFAGIGENMGAGIGVGFDQIMNKVSNDMQRAIPTDFNMDTSFNVMGSKASLLSATKSIIEHTGVIEVHGINNKSELAGVVEIIMDQFRREARI